MTDRSEEYTGTQKYREGHRDTPLPREGNRDPGPIKVESKRDNDPYVCNGPFQYGAQGNVCVHGWNTPHTVSDKEALNTDHLTNCGLLPARQNIEKRPPCAFISLGKEGK
jgi:hypothetical protein